VDDSKFFRASEVHDADFLADRLREIDIKEIEAVSGGTALEALLKGYYISDECNTIVIDKRPAGMFGVTPDYMTGGVIWMLGTPYIKDISITFLRESKKWVDQKCGEYSVLYNYVAIDNTIAINWLRFLGFNFKEHVDMRGMEFIRFERSA
jgi:hypothetical protein